MIDEKKLIEEIKYLLFNSEMLSPRWFAINEMLEIIKRQPRVEEWISIDDRLPTLGTWNIVTIKNHLKGGRRELRYPVTYMEKIYDVGYGFYKNGVDILLPEYSEVIAWQPLPEPWKEKTHDRRKEAAYSACHLQGSL